MNLLHHGFYNFMRVLITPYYWLKGYRWKRYAPAGKNYLALANHTTDWDFFLAGLVLGRHMYYVASEHIFRLGFVSWIIKTLADPIPRRKGAASDDTIKEIRARLSRGENVCIFADGNRSYNGETGFISPKTAQLAKDCGAGLVTVAVHGGYFISPRWAKNIRRGHYHGSVVNEYTAGQLARMSVDEIDAAIRKDLHVDAYADQEKDPKRYRGKNLAESLETALFWCPECGSYSSLYSSGNRFGCRNCGMELLLNEYGYFESISSKAPPFHTVKDWYAAELKQIHEYAAEERDENVPLFSDDALRLARVIPEQGTVPVAEGRLVLFKDRLEIQAPSGTFSIALRSIEKMAIIRIDTIILTADGEYYEIRPYGKPYSALKYLIASRLLAGKEYF